MEAHQAADAAAQLLGLLLLGLVELLLLAAPGLPPGQLQGLRGEELLPDQLPLPPDAAGQLAAGRGGQGDARPGSVSLGVAVLRDVGRGGREVSIGLGIESMRELLVVFSVRNPLTASSSIRASMLLTGLLTGGPLLLEFPSTDLRAEAELGRGWTGGDIGPAMFS